MLLLSQPPNGISKGPKIIGEKERARREEEGRKTFGI
jgi:hypothetical protein